MNTLALCACLFAALGQVDAIAEIVEAAVLVPFASLEEVAVGEVRYCVSALVFRAEARGMTRFSGPIPKKQRVSHFMKCETLCKTL